MPHGSNSLPAFIARWKESGAAERANCQLFLGELCDALGVERPHPAQADDTQNAYVFERAVTFQNPDGTTSPGRIDLYKRGCFILEAKQGSDPAQAAPLFDVAPAPASKGKARRGTAVRGTRGWDVAMQAARGQAERYVRARRVLRINFTTHLSRGLAPSVSLVTSPTSSSHLLTASLYLSIRVCLPQRRGFDRYLNT